MFNCITASAAELMEQAHMTAALYLERAVKDIETQFGKRAARQHPELVAAYMQAASIDMAGAIIAQQIKAGLDEIATTIANHTDRTAEDNITASIPIRSTKTAKA